MEVGWPSGSEEDAARTRHDDHPPVLSVGSSIPKPDGGVTRRIGEGLFAGH
jgi:hypothetical protein